MYDRPRRCWRYDELHASQALEAEPLVTLRQRPSLQEEQQRPVPRQAVEQSSPPLASGRRTER
ncbi:uncharacterized protein M421DRAFT_425288 [Didymella exigua CBS 183.55]|uniref:Uncharacterized protein n=1 Tax=Didymella exigua CBS 183.55 TaxID=1150837 RepID=A0A6A5RE13_9PLEO|nr:uncharacterized protein M421DRAFT_425288 [Didymella exigua CBS 183.55]KAF1923947.1 hypothetical protein M421DRAFT_425288 [Didymella exigua CBS 183.55]